MVYTSTVTQKGQITLPKHARNKLNIKTHQKVHISVENGYIKIQPIQDITSIAGFLKDKVTGKGSIMAARDSFENGYERV